MVQRHPAGGTERIGVSQHTLESRPLIIRPGASTKWVWLPGPEDINREQLRSSVDPCGSVRVAVAGAAMA